MRGSLKELGVYYRNLTRNMVLLITFVSITPMILVSGLILFQFHTSFQEKVHAHLTTLVKKHKQNIDTFLKERLADIRQLARTFTFEELSNESFLQDRLATLQDEFGPVFVDLGVVNARGLQVAYAGPFKLGMALYSTADWFQRAMKSNAFISDVFLGLRGLPHFIVAVRENWRGDPWILRATIDFVAFNNLVEHIRIGETGFAFILNRNGEFQTKPFQEIVPGKGPYLELLRSDNSAGERPVSIGRMTGEAGVKNIFVASPLKEGDWLLVYQQKVSDAFSDFERSLRVTMVVLLLGLIAIVTTAFLLSRRMVGRIAKADREKHMMNEQVVETGKLASVGELAAGIAHEINNPVAIMVEEAGWIEDLLEEEDFKDGANLKEFRRALNQIRTQGKRCKEITHKLLSFARKTDERVQEFRIDEAIQEIVALSAQRAKYSNVTVKLNLSEDLPNVRLSQAELQQVLLNLINNALDAMEKQGGSLEISSREEEGILMIEVADNGPGIPAANLGRIFDPFFTTKPVGKGTGLGLSICYGIVKKLGGDIEVASTVGVGTTFRIKIPLEMIKAQGSLNGKGE
ncbi:MAG: sensor histidine kinase [Desulfobacteraceae bacterium]|nr:MAG: sensor histidine kinase [Desulfobacteraceae bacterium]